MLNNMLRWRILLDQIKKFKKKSINKAKNQIAINTRKIKNKKRQKKLKSSFLEKFVKALRKSFSKNKNNFCKKRKFLKKTDNMMTI